VRLRMGPYLSEQKKATLIRMLPPVQEKLRPGGISG
jgi:hypothetical protein